MELPNPTVLKDFDFRIAEKENSNINLMYSILNNLIAKTFFLLSFKKKIL